MLKRLPYLLSPVLVLAIAAAIRFLPFSHAEGDFWNNMRDALRTGHTVSTFLPGFYPYLCSLLYKPFGAAGIETFQAAIYLALAACTWFSIRRCTSRNTLAVLAACIVMLNPDLLSSIPKLWDTEMTALLLAALFALCLALDSPRGGGEPPGRRAEGGGVGGWPCARTSPCWSCRSAMRSGKAAA